MAAITYKIKNKEIVIDSGLLYVFTLFTNLFALNFLFNNINKELFNLLIMLLIVNSFFNSIFIKFYFDALFTKSKNLILLSIFFFFISVFMSPLFVLFLNPINNVNEILFLFILSLYLNVISPFWTIKKCILIFFISLLILFFIFIFKLNSLVYISFFVICFVILFIREIYQFKFEKKFNICTFYLLETLILAIDNFILNILLFDPLISYNTNIYYLLILQVSFFYLFKLYVDIEKYTVNILEGHYEIIKNNIKMILKIFFKYLTYDIITLLVVGIIFLILNQNDIFWVIYFLSMALFIYIIKINEFFNKIDNIKYLGILLFFYLLNLLSLVIITTLIFSILIYYKYKNITYDELIRILFYYYLKYLFKWGL